MAFAVLLVVLKQLHVIVVRAHTVDDAVFGDFNDSVCNGLSQLMVMGRENDVVGECFHAIVQSSDAFQVQMVGGLVEQQRTFSPPDRTLTFL